MDWALELVPAEERPSRRKGERKPMGLIKYVGNLTEFLISAEKVTDNLMSDLPKAG